MKATRAGTRAAQRVHADGGAGARETICQQRAGSAGQLWAWVLQHDHAMVKMMRSGRLAFLRADEMWC